MKGQPIILIVDDQLSARAVLEGVLVGQGYQLAFAPDGPQALKMAAELIPDVILLNVMMPQMDGFEATKIGSLQISGVAKIDLTDFFRIGCVLDIINPINT